MSVITCRSNDLRGVRELAKRRLSEAQYNYVGGTTGAWEVTAMTARNGRPLAHVSHLDVINGPLKSLPAGTAWIFSGLVRNTRYVTREEYQERGTRPLRFARTEPTCAALIAVRKSAVWWSLDHRERREIQETHSWEGMLALRYLSAIVRRWQHRRDVSDQFDDVTWFEYAPRDSAAFDDLLALWHASEEWEYVERDCDIRLVHAVN